MSEQFNRRKTFNIELKTLKARNFIFEILKDFSPSFRKYFREKAHFLFQQDSSFVV